MKTKTQFSNRILSLVLALVMVLQFAPATAVATESTGSANAVRYLDADGSEKFVTDAAEITSDTTTVANGWYVVKESVQLTEKITVSGTVHLILCDNATLTTSGVQLAKGNSLTIYAQSEDPDRMGSLISQSDTNGQAAIGGFKGGSGTLVINGGNISATSTKSFSAAIGCGSSSAYASAYSSDPITVNGGIVTATSSANAAAIGGSMNSSGCTVVVNGGIVIANAGRNGSGIGGGRAGGGGHFTQNGGIVLASCGHSDITHHAISIGNGANSTAKGTAIYNGGITFLKGVGILNANSFTLDQNFDLPEGATLTVESGKTLTVAKGGYLSISGTLINNGTIVNEGGILNTGTFTNNGSGSCGVYAKDHPTVSDVCILCGGGSNVPNLSDGVFYVSTTNHLFWLAEQINGGAVTFPVQIELVNDITIPADRPWTPILIPDGKSISFEGNGHTLTMEITDERETTGNFGLFSSLNYSFVRNLVLKGSVTGNSTENVGAIAASAYRTTFENIVSFVNVSNNCTTGGYAGGIVGYFGGKHNSSSGLYSKLVNCAVYADVSGYNAGGIIGHGWNGTQYYDMTGCLYMGNVTANGGAAGAIVGYQETDSNTCTFTNVFWNETDGLSFYGKRDTSNQVYNNTTARTSEEFSSGAIAWELNGGVTNGSQVWYQELGVDAYPLLSGATVYYGYSHICTEKEPIYSNTANYLRESPADHTYSTDCDTTCKYCDYVRTAPVEHTAETRNDTERHWKYCTVCGVTWDDGEHSMKYEDIGNAHKYFCTDCGYIKENEGHWYEDKDMGDGTHITQCIYCLRIFGEPVEHTLVTTDTGEGSHVTHCKTCSYTENNITPHSMVYENIEGTGRHKHYCTVCNYKEEESGHDIIVVDNGDGSHKAVCAYCTYFDSPENHIFEFGVCCICGSVELSEPAQVDGIYQISNVGELYWFAQLVNSGTTDASAVLTADIMVNRDIAGETQTYRLARWVPIGAESGFTGSFNGNYHTISGLYMNGSDATVGFIGNLNGGTVFNLGIIDSYFETDADNSCVGGVVAINNGTVSGCRFTGTILNHGADGFCGGIVGNNTDEGSVTNCYSVGSVSGENTGGIAGKNAGTVQNCYYNSTVYSGNAIGDNTGTVDTLTAGKTTEQFASGEVAYLLGTPWGQNVGEDSYPVLGGEKVYRVWLCEKTVYSNTDGDSSHNYDEHGFCIVTPGETHYQPAVDSNSDGCYEISNAGQLYWYAQYLNTENAEIYAELTADIVIPENAPNWEPINASYVFFNGNFHTISGLKCIGGDMTYVGLFGCEGWWYEISNLHITDSYFEGNGYVGAVVACMTNGGSVTNCYVTDTTVKGGGNDTGGLVGYLGNSTMSNCYSAAAVEGENAHTLVGYHNSYATVENCYYLSETETDDGGRTAAQFASGEVAYLLQGEQETHVWGQDIGTEDYPVFGGRKVLFDQETNTYYNDTAILGDLDMDGDVDAYDLTILARHVAGIETLTDATALKNADVDGDGDVDAYDLTMHARFVAGIITEWERVTS